MRPARRARRPAFRVLQLAAAACSGDSPTGSGDSRVPTAIVLSSSALDFSALGETTQVRANGMLLKTYYITVPEQEDP